jgi:hypothetical protein
MTVKLFLFPCVLILVTAQISIQNNYTLLTLQQNTSNLDPLLSKAVSYVLEAHP